MSRTNRDFLPNEYENGLIKNIQKYVREDYSLVRMTYTMLDKSTIDASRPICKLLCDYGIFDFETAVDGEKYRFDVEILGAQGLISVPTSFYRPKAKPQKKGDPRFWPSCFKRFVEQGVLVYLTVIEGKFVIIPLVDEVCNANNLLTVFGGSQDTQILDELIAKIRVFTGEWIESCSPYKKSPKDVGDTLEGLLGLRVNSKGDADYKGEVELKSKRSSSKTADTLFSQVPDWELSPIKSVREMILTYGYESSHEKRQGYKDLFVTVSNKPNPQGLFLHVDYDNEALLQMYTNGDVCVVTAIWTFDKLRQRLDEKHPKTAWVIADEKVIDSKYHFNYNKLELTQNPIFSQFLLLIEQGIVNYDWRGGHEVNGKGRVDKGHAFRLKAPKYRAELFGEREIIALV